MPAEISLVIAAPLSWQLWRLPAGPPCLRWSSAPAGAFWSARLETRSSAGDGLACMAGAARKPPTTPPTATAIATNRPTTRTAPPQLCPTTTVRPARSPRRCLRLVNKYHDRAHQVDRDPVDDSQEIGHERRADSARWRPRFARGSRR